MVFDLGTRIKKHNNTKVFTLVNTFYQGYKEETLYLLFGSIAFLLNVILFLVFDKFFCLNILIANAISWMICVSFQYFTNRTWVFDGETESRQAFIKQIVYFYLGRVITLIVEDVILVVFITWFCFDSFIVKFIAQIIVIIQNYIISKCIVFKK